jgi:Protein of unknown function (DUF1580)
MIETSNERLLPFTELVRFVPRRRGKKVHLSTLHRWATVGVNGIRLQVVQVGGTRCCSRESLERFWAALTAKVGLDSTESPHTESTMTRRKQSESAARELSKLGV